MVWFVTDPLHSTPRYNMPIRLSQDLIKDIAKDVEQGLNNKEACEVNGVTDHAMYKWIRVGKAAEDKPVKERTAYEKNCVKFVSAIKNARQRRKQRRIALLEESKSPTGIIFLMKNEEPHLYNRQPYYVLNFEKLEEYMVSEYTQGEINAIRKAIFAAEDRRESEVEYDEDTIFAEDGAGDNGE